MLLSSAVVVSGRWQAMSSVSAAEHPVFVVVVVVVVFYCQNRGTFRGVNFEHGIRTPRRGIIAA